MNIFEKASKEKIRFNTSQGMLSTEQLWELKLTPLAKIVRALKKELNKDNDDELSFLDSTVIVDKTVQLKFEVAKSVYISLKEEVDAEKTKIADKEHNAKIDAVIAKKQDKDLDTKTVDELLAMKK